MTRERLVVLQTTAHAGHGFIVVANHSGWRPFTHATRAREEQVKRGLLDPQRSWIEFEDPGPYDLAKLGVPGARRRTGT